jgi:hypothetical protein
MALSFLPLVLQNYHITPVIQTDIGEGPNTRGRNGALTSEHKVRKTSPIHEPPKQTWHNKHRPTQCKRIQCHVCSPKNKATTMKFKCLECNVAEHTNGSKYYHRNSRTEYLSVAFSWWIKGNKGGVHFAEGLYEGTETCQKDVYVCTCFVLPIWEKNKNSCLVIL